MSTALVIDERRAAAVIVLALRGWLVAYKGDEAFRDRVADLVRAGQSQILVDLSGVEYIDSGGVGVLVSTLLHVTRRGGQFKLLSPSERVARVLEITGLHEVFAIFAHERDALASYTASA